MTTTPVLRTSIDLDAELRKITQRQHLNQVHYLVQLVRHAMLCQPSVIEIQNRAADIVLMQNGQPFPDDELDLLQVVLDDERQDDEVRQRALSRLESEHGIAMLALLLNSESVEIRSGSKRVMAFHGRLRREQLSTTEPGYRLQFRRYAGNAADESRELTYYAATARTTLRLNGKPLNRAIRFDKQIIITRFENEDGYGAVGIPEQGELCHLQIYKHGIRLGTKQFPARDGMLFHGYWDSKLDRFEPQYHRSILAGEKHLFEYCRMMYTALDRHFHEFTAAHQQRVRKLLLGIPGESWPDSLGDLPIFHGQQRDFVLSMNDLLALYKRFHFLPFTQRPRRGAPAYIPRLTAEDLLHFRTQRNMPCHLLRQPVKPANVQTLQPKPLKQKPSQPADPAIKQLLDQLNHHQDSNRFHIGGAQTGLFEDENGRQLAVLPNGHPFIQEAERCLQRHPERIGWLRYRFLAAVRNGA